MSAERTNGRARPPRWETSRTGRPDRWPLAADVTQVVPDAGPPAPPAPPAAPPTTNGTGPGRRWPLQDPAPAPHRPDETGRPDEGDDRRGGAYPDERPAGGPASGDHQDDDHQDDDPQDVDHEYDDHRYDDHEYDHRGEDDQGYDQQDDDHDAYEQDGADPDDDRRAETPPLDSGAPRSVLRALLLDTARETGAELGPRATEDVVRVGERAHALALADPRTREHAAQAATEATEQAVERSAVVVRTGPHGQVSWERAGLVIPVLGVAPGVGASVTAAALFDTLDAAGIPTLLIDAADPARSGLTQAAVNDGSSEARRPHADVGIAYAKRGGGWIARLSTSPEVMLTEGMVPTPRWWLPTRSAPAVTVVDLGWDPWTVAASPLSGPGAWLESGRPVPRPLLVTAASRPSFTKANEFLSRLAPWIESGHVAEPAGLVVVGARRWPRGIVGMASRQFGELTDDAVFLPHDHTLAFEGVGPRPMARKLRSPLRSLLARWGLPVSAASSLPWRRSS